MDRLHLGQLSSVETRTPGSPFIGVVISIGSRSVIVEWIERQLDGPWPPYPYRRQCKIRDNRVVAYRAWSIEEDEGWLPWESARWATIELRFEAPSRRLNLWESFMLRWWGLNVLALLSR